MRSRVLDWSAIPRQLPLQRVAARNEIAALQKKSGAGVVVKGAADPTVTTNSRFQNIHTIVDLNDLMTESGGHFHQAVRSTDAMLSSTAFRMNVAVPPMLHLPTKDLLRPHSKPNPTYADTLLDILGNSGCVHHAWRRKGYARLFLDASRRHHYNSFVDMRLHKEYASPQELLDELVQLGSYVPSVYFQDNLYMREDAVESFSRGMITIDEQIPVTTYHASTVTRLNSHGFDIWLPFIEWSKLLTERACSGKEDAFVLGDRLGVFYRLDKGADPSSCPIEVTSFKVLLPSREDDNDLFSAANQSWEPITAGDPSDLIRRLLRGQTDWTNRQNARGSLRSLLKTKLPIDRELELLRPFQEIEQRIANAQSDHTSENFLDLTRRVQQVCVDCSVRDTVKAALGKYEDQWKSTQSRVLRVSGEEQPSAIAGLTTKTLQQYRDVLLSCLSSIVQSSKATAVSRFRSTEASVVRDWSLPEQATEMKLPTAVAYPGEWKTGSK